MGQIQYALPVACVREITNPVPLSVLSHAPAAVAGVADYRGSVVTVIDVRTRFGLKPVEPTRKTKWIVAAVGEKLVALVVDAVTEVFGKDGASLAPPPWLGAEAAAGLAGVTRQGGLVFVIDLESLRQLADPSASRPAGPAGIGASVEVPT